MTPDTEFHLIKDLRAMERSDLEKTVIDYAKAYQQSTSLNAQASIDLTTQAEVVNLLANSLNKAKSALSFWFMWSIVSTTGMLGLFLLLLTQ